MTFEWLIDPIAAPTFFADFYERKPLLIERQTPSKFAHLLDLDAIDRYLATTTPRRSDVFLVDAARDLNPDDYCLPDSDRIDLACAYQLFAEGATISIPQMHERYAPLSRLCRFMEKTFSSHFQTNIYLSPSNAQGFKTHFDSHDVFVLQVSGAKSWTLYDTPIALPLRGQAFDPDKHTPGSPTREFTMRAGDLFYCPRGLYHSARSTDEKSLHITLGLIAKTWADVMIEAVAAACLATPALRANLPIGFANPGFDQSKADAEFRDLIETVAREAEFAPLMERLTENFVTSRRPDLSGCLQEADTPLGHESVVAPRSDLIYLLREIDENIVLLFGASEISFPNSVHCALNFALENGPFKVSDLPCLDGEEKIVLVRRLLKEGMLVRQYGA